MQGTETREEAPSNPSNRGPIEANAALVPVRLPAPLPPPTPSPKNRRSLKLGLLAVLLIVGAVGGGYWWKHSQSVLPPGIAQGNGRLEADEIDIDTKFAGRIAKLFVDEGDLVTAGQVLARMDTSDLEASLNKAQAQISQAQRAIDEANSNLEQLKTARKLAKQELDRTSALVSRGYATVELLDQRRQQMDAAEASVAAAVARVSQAEHARDAATHDAELYQVDIADNTLIAPREGLIQYRTANTGEVLGAGGRVFVMLDTAYVYMDIYLPTAQSGRVKLRSDARIVLDAYPKHVIPAKVVFVAAQAQFTPKTVETAEEREKLMFRVRVQVDPERLRGRAGIVKTGLPGVAYVAIEPDIVWPPQLQASAPP